MSELSISVVIPCYPPHITYLPDVIKNILNQSELPDEIIIAVSEINPTESQELELQLNSLIATSEKQIKMTVAGTIVPCFAGINRNRGACLANGDYIMFMDSDDLYHRQKIEITKKIIQKYKPNLILHDYHYLDSMLDTEINLEQIQIVLNDTIYHNTFGNPPMRYFDKEQKQDAYILLSTVVNIHHGVVTVAKSVLNVVRYTARPKGQDALFDRDVLWYVGNVVACDAKLMLYKPTTECRNKMMLSSKM